MGKITRKVKIEAQDPKLGMTCLELLSILAQAPPDMVPKVLVGMNGRIKRVELEIEFNQVPNA